MAEQFGRGDKVKLSQPGPGEDSARYVVTEWNGDRGFIQLISHLRIPPVELVRACDIVIIERASNA